MGANRIRKNTFEQWLLVALLGIVAVGILPQLAHGVLQVIFHTVGYIFVESYREHISSFGGYTGYWQTQLIPRFWYSLISNWFLEMTKGILLAITLYAILKIVSSINLPNWMVPSGISLLWIGWHNGRRLVIDPFWGIIDSLVWILCIFALYYALKRTELLSDGGEV
ncbi:MAG: hypothetical protein KatS3mg016_0772 [Fimbriimonadales bacterium]|nr:MAG: hypothetical protein KatS3mg016_0772 [Fimbriimonadales bacterium]